jgi:hypothetical protein
MSNKSTNTSQKRNERKAANYDPKPPCCGNCKSYGRRPKELGFGKWCFWIGFQLPSASGVCDHWRGKDGAVLEVLETL